MILTSVERVAIALYQHQRLQGCALRYTTSDALLIALVFPSRHQSTLCAQAGLMRSFPILVCW